jgi:HD-GYP domain-containing protein (c-di-GMP phosphodiesterase class II)
MSYLATGALLHDAGMLRIPEAIVKKKGRLSDEELQKMRAHPLLTYKNHHQGTALSGRRRHHRHTTS